jgi:hypothetical protein
MFMGGVEAAHRLLRRHADKECNLINCSNEIGHPRSSTQRWDTSELWCDRVRTTPAIARGRNISAFGGVTHF